MKQLKEYKIETLGLNPAILHKAKEMGYEDCLKYENMLTSIYLFLYANGQIFYDNDRKDFKETTNTQIHPHDFLRLNWTPKVGEEVEYVGEHWSERIGKKYILLEGADDCEFIIDNGKHWFIPSEYLMYNFIPVLPKSKEENSEKPDAYIDTDQNVLVVRMDGHDVEQWLGCYDKCNLISEAVYVKRYDDKLTFKGWEVVHDEAGIKIGCERATKKTARLFMEICSICRSHGVSPSELEGFLNENKQKLGL